MVIAALFNGDDEEKAAFLSVTDFGLAALNFDGTKLLIVPSSCCCTPVPSSTPSCSISEDGEKRTLRPVDPCMAALFGECFGLAPDAEPPAAPFARALYASLDVDAGPSKVVKVSDKSSMLGLRLLVMRVHACATRR